MGSCNSSKHQGAVGGREYTVAILGLDNAGKTCTVKRLKGEDVSDVAPTIGFSNEEVNFAKQNIKIYDLGGGQKFRDVWKRYFGELYGLIYVVDASKHERIEEGRAVLEKVMEHPKITQKPILILGNKQDVEGAMDEVDIVQGLGIESLANKTKTPCRVELCSTADVAFAGKKQDAAIRKGFAWLIDSINTNYDLIHKRVSRDVAVQKAEEDREKQEKRERVNKLREERAREQQKQGQGQEEGADEVDGPNPFRPINDTIKLNEERMRKEKSASKGAAGSKSSATRDELTNGGERRASVDRENVPPSSGRGKGNRDYDDDGSGAAASNSQSPRKVKKSGSFSSAKDTSDGGKQSPPVYDDSTARGMTAATSLGNLSGRKGSAILPTPMKPLPLEAQTKSSKKAKKNQTAPAPYAGDSGGSQSSLAGLQLGATLHLDEGERLAHSGTLQQHRANLLPPHAPRLSAGGDGRDTKYNRKKTRARGSDEDSDGSSPIPRTKPNYDSDNIET